MLFKLKTLLITTLLVAAPQAAWADELKVEHIANAGVRISSGNQTVLVDALFGPHDYFNSLSNEEQEKLNKQGADLAMATHIHADHFGVERTAAFLKANPQTLFIGTPKMLTALDGQVRPHQVVSEVLTNYQSRQFSHRSINVTVLDFPHMLPVNRPTVNYAYIIEMNGWTILHVGDAGMTEEAIRGIDISDKNIDIAILHDLFPVRQKNYKDLIKLMNVGKVAFMHMVDEKAEPMAKWLQENMPDGAMLVTGHETVTLNK